MAAKPSLICITGASGFIGRHLTSRLLKEPGVRVRCLSRKKTAPSTSECKAEWFQGDLRVPRTLEGFIERDCVVVHLAYAPQDSRAEKIEAAVNLARAVAEGGARRLIHVSTAVLNGPSGSATITETSACHPASEYQETKIAIERALEDELSGRSGLSIIRPTCVYGPGGKNLLKLCREAESDPLALKYAKRSILRHRRLNLVHVANVVEAIWHVARLEAASGETFIVSEDDLPENNFGDVSAFVEQGLGLRRLPAPVLALPKPLLRPFFAVLGRSHANATVNYSCEKLLRSGYRRPVSFREGLDDFLAWYRRQRLP